MRCRPRVVSSQVVKIADFPNRAVDACCGPDATFEQREQIALTLMREALARYARTGKGVLEPDGEGDHGASGKAGGRGHGAAPR